MSKIGFIGLDTMGLPMAKNLLKGDHSVKAFDLSSKAMSAAKKAGMETATSVAEAVKGVDVVISMVPDAKQSRATYLNNDGILKNADPGTFLIDCSNIYIATARDIHNAAKKAGFQMIDAPATGGVGGAKAGSLTFLVRGDEKAFLEGEAILDPMAGNVFHLGPVGRQSKNKTAGEDAHVIYKNKPRWKGPAAIVILLFLGGNAILLGLIEDNIKIVDDQLMVTYSLESYEKTFFCRASKLLGLDINGC